MAEEILLNRRILITGAARGLGAAIARNLLATGARLVLADLDGDGVRRQAETLSEGVRDPSSRAPGSGEGARPWAVALDVGDPDAVDGLMKAISERLGGLDVVINNAAIDQTVPVDELAVDAWLRIVRTNLTGPFLLVRAALPLLKQSDSAHVVNIASTASRRAWANASAYHATKWGLLGLSHALHAELRTRGIKVSAVIAGGMRTPFLLDRFPDLDPGLLQDPATVADTVRFVLTQPRESVVPEIMVLPMRETSWP